MTTDNDPLKEYLNPDLKLFPEVDLEASIMATVREEAKLQAQAQQLRRKGLMCLTAFLLLLGLALWQTSNGYSHPVYEAPLIGLGITLLFLLALFAQLEAWKGKLMPERIKQSLT